MPNVQLFHGDCLDVLDSIDPGTVDLVVTSPPYDNLRNYQNSLEWNEDIWAAILEKLHGVMVPGGVVVWVVGDSTISWTETGTSFKQALHAKSVGFNLHDTMIYMKSGPPSVDILQKRYYQEFEYMFIFSKGPPSTCNHLKTRKKYTDKEQKRNAFHRNADGTWVHGIRSAKKDKIKGNVWRYSVGWGNSASDKMAHAHPAIFPEQLALDHVLSWSNPGDVVLDPMMGSGTVGKVSVMNDRRFIGVEKVHEYYELAKKRIESAINTPKQTSLLEGTPHA